MDEASKGYDSFLIVVVFAPDGQVVKSFRVDRQGVNTPLETDEAHGYKRF